MEESEEGRISTVIILGLVIAILIAVQIWRHFSKPAAPDGEKKDPRIPREPLFGKTLAHEDNGPVILDGEVAVEGVLVRVLIGPGTLSEHWGYALHTVDTRPESQREIPVEMERDSPGRNETLDPYATRLVRVTGRMWNKRLIGRRIEELSSKP